MQQNLEKHSFKCPMKANWKLHKAGEKLIIKFVCNPKDIPPK